MRLRLLLLFLPCLAFAREARAFVVPFDGPNSVGSLVDPTSVRAADFDRDGDLDLVAITETAGGTVTWFENVDGSGSSWTPHTIAVKISTGSTVSPADIDGDGDVDVLATLPSETATVWYENTSGDGSTWSAAQTVNDTASGHASSVAGDFDRDGDLDVAVGSSGTIRWFVNEAGDGSDWSAANSVGQLVSGSAVHIDVADVDRDGWLDVVAAWDHVSGAGVGWYRNTGSFALGAFHSLGIDGPVWVAPARMDADADVDLLVTTESGEMLWLDNTNGIGTSLSPVAISFSGGGPRAAVPFDLDGDSDLDVVIPLSDELRWYENADGAGTSWIPRDLPTPGGAVLRSATVAYIDSDGDPDLVATSSSGDEVFFDRNLFVHRRAAATENTVASAAPAQVISAVAVADMDGDGDDDAVGANYSTDTVTWYANNFGTGWSATQVASGMDGVWDVATADLDRDGDPDVLAVATNSDQVSWFANSSGGASFSETVIVNVHSGPSAISSADIDGDGDPDVLLAFAGEGRFSWYENTAGDGSTWSEHVVASSVAQPVDVVAHDVDRDGDLDVVGLSVGDETLRWYENTAGNGSAWSAHVVSAATSFANAVALADVDGDGDVDAASYGSNQLLAWHENTAGNGSAWSSATISTESSQGRALVFTDFDLDGDPDLIAAPGDTSAATFWENDDGSGNTWVEHALAGPDFPTGWQQAIAVTDVEGDGAPDLLIAHGDAARLSWYANALRHVGLVTASLAPGAILSATSATVLSIDVTHQGRAGDLAALFDVLELRLTDGFNTSGGLSTGQADALIASLSLYADDGDLVSDAGDTFVGGLGAFSIPAFGFQSLDLNETQPELEIAAGVTKRFFIAVELMSDAHSQSPRSFQISARGNFTDDFPSPLSLLESGLPTRVIAAASTTSDFDGDGARDLVETDTGSYVSPGNLGSDPFDSDSDDDGFSDGFEVVARTNPNLLASAPPSMAFTAVEAGLGPTSCGVLENGELSCWGSDAGFALTTPLPWAFRRVEVSDDFACGLLANDALACWGDLSWVVVSETDPNYVDISVGPQHVCALRVDLTLECFGTNSFGLFTEPSGVFRSVVSGEDFACALDLSGVPVCWGNSANGRTTPPAGETFVELGAGSGHACGVRTDGTVLCWGLGTSGQTTVPAQTFTHVAPGEGFTCGTRSDGALQCWGNSAFVDTPESPYVRVSAGRTHVCALQADGRAACMLNNESGQGTPRIVAFPDVALGDLHGCSLGASRRAVCWGDSSNGKTAPPVTSDIAAIGLGDQQSCAIEQDGDAICFGANTNGEATSQPASGNPFVQVDGGTGHTCGVRADGSVTCWGSNLAPGQSTPDAGSYVQVSAGGINNTAAHTCGITTTGLLRCWGTNTVGQAADQSGTWTQVSAGQAFTCGVRSDGSIGCFGQNISGQVSGAPAGIFSEVAAGRFHACAREPNGTVRCWGDSSSGKTAPPPGKFVRIAAVADRSCGVLEDGSIACWGANYIGETSPPLDFDDDAREDGADNCPSVPNFSQLDLDLDDVGDGACDLCPAVYDPDHLDRDGDLVGDACDNCVDVYNPGQEDAVGSPNGIGDACESTVVFIRPAVPPPPGPPPGAPSGPGLPPPPPAGEALYDVFLYCPATAIQKVQLGVIMPEGATAANVNFGLGCTATSCAGGAGNGLAAVVDPVASFAKGPDPAFATAGARGDTVYFSLQATPAATLCDPGGAEIETRVAQFQIANPVADMPTPSLTKEGLSAPPVNLLEPLVDDTGRVLEPAEYSFASVNQDPTVAVTLEPAAGDTSGRRWQVELDTDIELHRVTFGLVAPAGTTTTQMRFIGCTTASGPQPTRRSCSANAALGPFVAPATSFSVGPGASTAGLRTDTLYVTVGGARASGAPLPALNVAGQAVVLGIVELDPTTVAPALTLDGVGTSSVFGPPYIDSSNTTVTTPLVQVGGGYNAPSDYDADGRSDDLDNCPYTANVTQANNGGFLTTTPDLYGDSCQCADGDGNGAVFAADTAALRSVLTGQASAAVASRCSVAGGPECDVRDYAVFRRAIAGLGPGISSVCASAVRGSQLPAPP